MFNDDLKIKELKEKYPKGTKIKLRQMQGEERMPYGLNGVVYGVDDIGQVHVSWDNGSSLALNIDVDQFDVISLPCMKFYSPLFPKVYYYDNDYGGLDMYPIEVVNSKISEYEMEILSAIRLYNKDFLKDGKYCERGELI